MQESNDAEPQHCTVIEACADVCRLFIGGELLLTCDRVVVLREVNAGREYLEVIYFLGDVVRALDPLPGVVEVKHHYAFDTSQGLSIFCEG
jgi:hypothetical protein